jgi:glycosyltransferase involved in cell wall biosynthesis
LEWRSKRCLILIELSFRKKFSVAESQQAKTSIIIPSLNSPLIDQVVEKVLEQDGFTADDELIVVGRDDSGLIKHLAGVQFIDTGQPVTAPVARNLGIDRAKGQLLIFIDSDCVPQPGWLNEHRRAHSAGHEVVGGGVLPTGDNYWHLTYNLTMFHEIFSTAPPGERPFLPTLNLSVERDVITKVGKLDPTLKKSQDLDWTTRMNEMGFRLYFWPKASIRHDHNRRTGQQVWRDAATIGYYARQVRIRHQESLDTPSILQNRRLTLWLSPFIALYVTGRIIARRPKTMLRHPETWPAIFMSKIAWCWGASRE